MAFTIAGVSLARVCCLRLCSRWGQSHHRLRDHRTGALAARVGAAIVDHDAILMDRHGAVCVGSSLLDAFCKLETMEHTALITKTARDLGHVRTLDSEEAVRLRSMGLKRYGGPPSAVAKADDPGADLPAVCTECTTSVNDSPQIQSSAEPTAIAAVPSPTSAEGERLIDATLRHWAKQQMAPSKTKAPFIAELGLVLVSLSMLSWLLLTFAGRVGHPYDLEWMGSAECWCMVTECSTERPLCSASIDFIPYIYPPLYSWALAAFGAVFGLDYDVGRSISLMSTLFAAAAIVEGSSARASVLGSVRIGSHRLHLCLR